MLTSIYRRWTVHISAGNQCAQIAYASVTTVSMRESDSLIVEDPLVEALAHTFVEENTRTF